jgi:hypothetical protein
VTVLEAAGHAVEVQVAEQLAVTDAAQQVRLLLGFAERLELPRAFLRSQELMERSEHLGQVVRDGQVKARQVQAEGMRRLVQGPAPIALSDVTSIVHEVDCWLDADVSAGRVARAVDLAMAAARMARGQAFRAAVAESSGFYAKLQKLAAATVAETAALPALPRQLLSTPDPAGLMIRSGRGGDWAVMVMGQERFELIAEAGKAVRALGGLGAQGLLNGPPHLAFNYKRWDRAMAGRDEWLRLEPGLRLRYAIDHKWEPGLWLSSDVPERPVVSEPPRRGMLEFLIPSPLCSPVGAP